MVKTILIIILMFVSDAISTYIFTFKFTNRKNKIIGCFLLVVSMVLLAMMIGVTNRCPECGKFSSDYDACPKCGYILRRL